MLPIALQLAAAFAPQLIGALTKSNKAEDIATKVVAIAQTVAGVQGPALALEAIERDPSKQAAFAQAISDNELELARVDASVSLGHLDLSKVEAKEWTGVVEALADAEKAGASTRPRIAMWMAALVCANSATLVLTILLAAMLARVDVIVAVTGAWEFLAVATAAPLALLRAYFGLRTDEKRDRATVAMGQAPHPKIGMLAGLLRKA